MNQHTRNEVIGHWNQGQSIRSIAKSLHLSRETVRRIIDQHRCDRGDVDSPAPSRKRRPSKLDQFEPHITRLLERYPAITVQRILEELRQQGYDGGYSILCERVALLRRAKPQKTQWVERFETAPGVQAQMDWAVYTIDFTCEGRRRVNLFSYVLGYSRRQYLRFTESQDFETTLREHVRAFEHLGGVAATCLYDNMKIVVSRYEDGEPVYNPRFLAFATHYGYRPIACRVRRPQTKGKVERPFDYVEKSLLNGREFRSLEHLNDVTAWWLSEIADVRKHGTTKQRPIDRHAEELPHLIALPARPYDVSQMVYRDVDAEGFVSWRGNRYSVPWTATKPGTLLPVKITENEVIVYGRQIEEIARHPLLPETVKKQDQVRPEHRPPRDRRLRREKIRSQMAELGDIGERFLAGLRQEQRECWKQAESVLALLATYHRRDLVAALERAITYGAYSLKSVKRILFVQAQPKTSLEHLAEESRAHLSDLLSRDPTPPRSIREYQKELAVDSLDSSIRQEHDDSTKETHTGNSTKAERQDENEDGVSQTQS